MKKYNCLAFLLCFTFVARCHNDIPLDISLKVPNRIYMIEEVKLLGNARELLFSTILDDDYFHPITDTGVLIDADWIIATNRVELLRTPEGAFLRIKTLNRITEDGKKIMLYICYFYENGKWMLSDTKHYNDHKLQYMNKVTVAIPFTENEDIKLIKHGDIFACIAKHDYAVIEEVTKDGRVIWHNTGSNGNRIIQLAYKRRLGIFYLTATIADKNKNACAMTFLIIGNKAWPSYYNIDEISPEFQEVIATIDSHYMPQRTVTLLGNMPFTPTSPFDIVDTLPEAKQGLSNNPIVRLVMRLGIFFKIFTPSHTVDVNLTFLDVEKSHCSRIYHFSAPGSPYSLTLDAGYVFGKVEWDNTVVFYGLEYPPYYMVYYESNAMQSLYTFSLDGENIVRVQWLYAPANYEEEAQWVGAIVRAENFYPPPLTLDISKPFDSRFYEIVDAHTNHPGAAYVTPRKEFKLKDIVDGDVTIHVFKRPQRATVGINTILSGYIHIFDIEATAGHDTYSIYKKEDDNRWVQADDSTTSHDHSSSTDESYESAEDSK